MKLTPEEKKILSLLKPAELTFTLSDSCLIALGDKSMLMQVRVRRAIRMLEKKARTPNVVHRSKKSRR